MPNRQLTFSQYRAFDLAVFAILIAVFEAINIIAITRWFASTGIYMLSLLIPLLALVYMRWNTFALIHAGIGGLVYCIVLSLSGGANTTVDIDQYLIYCIGNMGSSLVLILHRIVGKDKICSKASFSILYVLTIYLGVELGRTVVALVLGNNVALLVRYLSLDCLCAVIGIVIILIARRQNGMFADQRQYLLAVAKEQQEFRTNKDQGML